MYDEIYDYDPDALTDESFHLYARLNALEQFITMLCDAGIISDYLPPDPDTGIVFSVANSDQMMRATQLLHNAQYHVGHPHADPYLGIVLCAS